MSLGDEITHCLLCRGSIEPLVPDGRDVYRVSCAVCSSYHITEEAAGPIRSLSDDERTIISARAREQSERGGPPLHIDSDNIDAIVNDPRVPRWPIEKIDRLLLSLYRRSRAGGSAVDLSPDRDRPVAYASSIQEFVYILEKGLEQGYIDQTHDTTRGRRYRLTVKGWDRVRELEGRRPRSDQCFVAMWFDPSLDQAFESGIRPAAEEAGYKALRVDLKEHNEKICDVIVAEIRRSALLVADCTGHRQGVYFEAGFAMGLGILCIFTCREDDIKRAHFDTRQYNHIVWSDPRDLYTKLLRRILATVPPGGASGRA